MDARKEGMDFGKEVKMTEGKSEFGKGLVICLVKFAEHFENDMYNKIMSYNMFLKKSKEDIEKVRSTTPPPNLDYGYINKQFDWWLDKIVPICGNPEKALSKEIELWLSGASDHLYEIECPEGKEWDEIRNEVIKLQNKGLEIGHGFMLDKIWKFEDINELENLTEEISLMIDKKIGLNPDIGNY